MLEEDISELERKLEVRLFLQKLNLKKWQKLNLKKRIKNSATSK
jgi:hypothetical protein